MGRAGRKLLYSSIWKRFVIQFSVVTGIFLIATLLMILRVSLPVSSELEQRQTDKQILLRDQQVLLELETIIAGSTTGASSTLEFVKEKRADTNLHLEKLQELATLLNIERSPETSHSIDERIKVLGQELTPLLQTYPAEKINRSIHFRMILILLVIFVCLGGMMYVFVSDVVGPLEAIIETARRVAEGDMAVSFPLRVDLAKRDELDDLAMILNDLLANLQEAFLLIGALNKESSDASRGIADSVQAVRDESQRENISEYLEQCTACMAEIDEILQSFDFFTTVALGNDSDSREV